MQVKIDYGGLLNLNISKSVVQEVKTSLKTKQFY